MPLVDDLAEPLPERELSRRKLLGLLGTGALTAAGLGTLVTGVQYLRPNVLFEPATRFPVGRPDDLPVGGVLDLPSRRLFVVRDGTGFFAMSSVCTHLGCMVRRQADRQAKESFLCPCHGSRFALDGKVLGGPAPRPLDRVHLEIDDGKLVVDVSRTVPHDTVVRA
jgi:nitrite reductase/ring-hydroxylating ferredoxin subunit